MNGKQFHSPGPEQELVDLLTKRALDNAIELRSMRDAYKNAMRILYVLAKQGPLIVPLNDVARVPDDANMYFRITHDLFDTKTGPHIKIEVEQKP